MTGRRSEINERPLQAILLARWSRVDGRIRPSGTAFWEHDEGVGQAHGGSCEVKQSCPFHHLFSAVIDSENQHKVQLRDQTTRYCNTKNPLCDSAVRVCTSLRV